MSAAALGTTLTLPTLEADVEQGADSEVETAFDLDIRPGTQSGTEQVLRGRGVPGRGAVERGDLVVTIVVETPTRLDARQEELLRELAGLRGEHQPAVRSGPPRDRCSASCATRSIPSTDVAAGPLGAVAVRRCGRLVGRVVGDEAHHAMAVRRLRRWGSRSC